LPDAYLSVVEALKHAGFKHGVEVNVDWVDAENLEAEEVEKQLSRYDGVLVPGGFGVRGIEGKVEAIRYVRENNLPFLGICLGLQCAVVEFARNVLGLKDANSTEFEPNTPYPVIDLLPEQKGVTDLGGTMRLGAYPCQLKPKTKAWLAYKKVDVVQERHRHRYEVNNEFRQQLEEKGLIGSGLSPDGKLVEVVEISSHPWFVACQFHPEFKSRPNRPHPLFDGFIEASLRRKRGEI
jgi:CTP synthase